jgi:hypothetical protein
MYAVELFASADWQVMNPLLPACHVKFFALKVVIR